MCKTEMIMPRALYEAYPAHDLLPITPPTEKTSYDAFAREAEQAGDTLFLFLLRELCSPTDPCTATEANARLGSAIRDLEEVRDALAYG